MLPKKVRLMIFRLLILFLPINIGYLYIEPVSHDMVMVFDALLFILYMDWFVGAFSGKKVRFIYPDTLTPGILMIIWSFLSVIMAISIQATIFASAMVVKAVCFHLYFVNNVDTRKELKVIIFYLFIGLIFQDFLAFYEKFAGRSLGLQFLGEWIRSYHWDLARISGTMGFPNHLGTFMVMVLWFSLASFIIDKKNKFRTLHLPLIGVTVVAIIFTFTRACWFGLGVSVFMVFLLLTVRRGMTLNIIGAGLVLMLVAIIVLAPLRNLIFLRLGAGGDPYRVRMIEIAFNLIRMNPLIGVGLFNFEYHSYSIFAFWKPVHNTYLRLAAETGIPGMLFYIWYIVLVFRAAGKATRIKDHTLLSIAYGVIGCYIAFAVIILLGPEYAFYRLKVLFWIVGAFPYCLIRIRNNEIRAIGQRRHAQESEAKTTAPGSGMTAQGPGSSPLTAGS